jgi:hypothetical protein
VPGRLDPDDDGGGASADATRRLLLAHDGRQPARPPLFLTL